MNTVQVVNPVAHRIYASASPASAAAKYRVLEECPFGREALLLVDYKGFQKRRPAGSRFAILFRNALGVESEHGVFPSAQAAGEIFEVDKFSLELEYARKRAAAASAVISP